MIIAITGTPGVGKTSVATGLREKGYDVVDINTHIRENGLLGKFDDERDTYDVDIVKLNASLNLHDDRTVFLDGHLSHFLKCDMIVVLRCNPSILYERLKKRGYQESKIIENVQAEALDVILCESLDSGTPTFEVDCTSVDTNTIISSLHHILAGDTEEYRPGSVNWGEEMVKWC